MGRKKKQQAVEIKKSETTNIGYQGKVTVSILRGNKVISRTKNHNTGHTKLFLFLCKALQGDFDTNLRPCRIALFTIKDENEQVTNPYWTPDTAITSKILNDTTAIVDPAANSVTYHFRIPISYISIGNDKISVYKAALYGNNVTDEYDKDKAATYLFADLKAKQWEPIIVDMNKKGNYSIIIEWTMTISNMPGQEEE